MIISRSVRRDVSVHTVSDVEPLKRLIPNTTVHAALDIDTVKKFSVMYHEIDMEGHLKKMVYHNHGITCWIYGSGVFMTQVKIMR